MSTIIFIILKSMLSATIVRSVNNTDLLLLHNDAYVEDKTSDVAWTGEGRCSCRREF